MIYITFTYHSVNFSYNTKYAEYNRKFTFLPQLSVWSIWKIICTIYYSNTKILFGLFGTASVRKMSDIGCMHLWTQEKRDEDDDDIKMILVGAEMLHTISGRHLSLSYHRRGDDRTKLHCGRLWFLCPCQPDADGLAGGWCGVSMVTRMLGHRGRRATEEASSSPVSGLPLQRVEEGRSERGMMGMMTGSSVSIFFSKV